MPITRVSRAQEHYKMSGLKWAATIIAALLLAASGASHFAMPEQVQAWLPAWLPQGVNTVYAFGAIELLLAIGLLIKATRPLAGLWAVLYAIFGCVIFFPLLQNPALPDGTAIPLAVVAAAFGVQIATALLAFFGSNAKAHLVRCGLSGLFRPAK